LFTKRNSRQNKADKTVIKVARRLGKCSRRPAKPRSIRCSVAADSESVFHPAQPLVVFGLCPPHITPLIIHILSNDFASDVPGNRSNQGGTLISQQGSPVRRHSAVIIYYHILISEPGIVATRINLNRNKY